MRNVTSRIRPRSPIPVRGGGGGCRYRVTVLTASGGKTARPFPFAEPPRAAPRPTPLLSVVLIMRAAPSGRLPKARIAKRPDRPARPKGSEKAGREPLLDLAERRPLTRGVVLELVAPDPSDREVPGLRMGQVDAAHGRRRCHREALGQPHARIPGTEQLEQLRLLTVVGGGRVAGRREDAPEALCDLLLL